MRYAGAGALLAILLAGASAGPGTTAAAPKVASPRAAQAPVREPLARLIPAAGWDRVAEAGEPAVPRAHHPVEGAVADYGEAGARFGAGRSGHVHEGQDVFAPAGTPLVAVRDGVVVGAGSDAGRGNHVAIFSAEAGETYVYFHLLAPASVSVGERVRGGSRIGELGCSGSCFGDHLHFEVHQGEGAAGPAIDPLPLLQDWG